LDCAKILVVPAPVPCVHEETKSAMPTYLNQLDDLEVEVLFRALDRPEHAANLLSLELTGAWVNEAREVPYAVIKALKGRVDRYPPRNEGGCVDPGIWMDSNPPEDASWWFHMFEENRTDDEADARSVEIFKQPSGRSATTPVRLLRRREVTPANSTG
jgi:hypothetical protein